MVVMNWIDGTDLQHVLDADGASRTAARRRHRRPRRRSAAALDHLHAHEPPVVHGDVKPANLDPFRHRPGRARRLRPRRAQTADAGRVGTIGFVAPEVARR